MNDSIQAILDDCSLPPSVYVERLGRTGDSEECISTMCRDLIGRTIAQMGRDGNIGRAYSKRTCTWFRIGDHVTHVNKRDDEVGEVVGTAIDDRVKCLVVKYGAGDYDLMAVDFAFKVGEPTADDIHAALDSKVPADKLLKLVEAYVKARG